MDYQIHRSFKEGNDKIFLDNIPARGGNPNSCLQLISQDKVNLEAGLLCQGCPISGHENSVSKFCSLIPEKADPSIPHTIEP